MFPSYSTGTVSIESGATTVVGEGADWGRANAREGDELYIKVSGDFVGPWKVMEVNSEDTELTVLAWPHATVEDADYKLMHSSTERVGGTRSLEDLDRVVATLHADGFYYFVPSDAVAPDPSLGDNGQYARQPATGKEWYKENDAWVFLGTFGAVSFQGAWSSATEYSINMIVTRLGKAYYAKRITLNDPPESSPDDWGLLIDNGDTIIFSLYDADRPYSAEQFFKFVAYTTTIFPQNLTASRATADVAATASAVFSLQKNGVEFATITFAMGATTGTFVCAADTTFSAGDIFTVVAPNPRDTTLAGVALTIVVSR